MVNLRIRGGLETRDAQWEGSELLARTWDTLPLWNEGGQIISTQTLKKDVSLPVP